MGSADDFDSWDPLTEDYHNKNNNTYNTGAGANLPSDLQPANYQKGEDNLFTLWIRPLSNRYTDESLKNIFAMYGEVIDGWIVSSPKNGSAPFGYVTYKTQDAAIKAIRGFNDSTSFDFKVSYAKSDPKRSDSNKNNQKRNRDDRRPNRESNNRDRESNNRDRPRSNRNATCNDSDWDGSVNGRNGYRDSLRSNSPANKDRRGEDRRNSLLQSIRSNSPPNKDRSIISFAFSQDLFPSKKEAIAAEPERNLNAKMKPDIEPKMNGVSYTSPSQCNVCKKLTFQTCSSCNESFCSQECSLDGWRTHRGTRCVVVADLVRGSSQTREPKPATESSTRLPIRGQLASEAVSPGNECSRFAHLAKDYLESGRSYETADTKFHTVLDNNYEDNVDSGAFRDRNSRDDQSRNAYGVEPRTKRIDRDFSDSEKSRNAYGDSRSKRYDNKDGNDTDRSKTFDSDSREGCIGFKTKKLVDRRPRDDRKPQSNDRVVDSSYSRRNDQRNDRRSDRRNDDEAFTPQANSSAIDEIDLMPYLTGRLRLKADHNSEVIVISIASVSQRLCYVKMADEDDTITSMMKKLNEIIAFQPLEKIVPKAKCVAKHRGTWYRALIENDSPLRVKLIDFGINVTVQPDDVRTIPSTFAQIPPFSHSVILPSVPAEQLVSWKETSEVITIKPSAQENKTWIAETVVEPSFEEKLAQAKKERDLAAPKNDEIPKQKPSRDSAPVAAPTPVAVPKSPKNQSMESDSLLTAGVATKVVVTWIKDERVFFVSDVQKFMDEFTKTAAVDFEKLKPLDDISPGMLTMNFFSGICCRAKVVSTNPFKVSYIDYGNVELCEAKDMRQIPPECATTPPLAVQVRITDGTVEKNNISENEPVIITPITKDKDTPNAWIVCVGDKSANFEELKEKYTSSTEELSSSTIVEVNAVPEPKPPIVLDLFVTYGVSTSEYYAIRKSDVGVYESLITKLNKDFPKADGITEGEVYTKKFEGLWCRARVTNLQPLTIYFIDYGNTETCDPNELHALPDDLQKDPPPMAFKVLLKNPTNELLEYESWINVLWDMNTDTYTLLRDPSATEPKDEAATASGSGVFRRGNLQPNAQSRATQF